MTNVRTTIPPTNAQVRRKPGLQVQTVSVNSTDPEIANAYARTNLSSPVINPGGEENVCLADRDSRYTRLSEDQLPSSFLFYPFKTISIRPFNLLDLKKLYKGHATRSFRTIAQVINSTIDQDVFGLTVGDYWYLLYWHRVNSYLKAPMKLKYTCSAPEHLDRIESGELQASTLQGTTLLNQSTLGVLHIEDPDALARKVEQVRTDYNDLYLYPTRVIDVAENNETMEANPEMAKMEASLLGAKDREDPTLMVEAMKVASKFKDEEWFNEYAACLHPKHGRTLQERAKFLEGLGEKGYGWELLNDIDEFMEMSAHGVKEQVTSQCEVCKAKIETTVSVDALHFFPDLHGSEHT